MSNISTMTAVDENNHLPAARYQTTPMTLLEKAMTMDGVSLDKLEALFDLQVRYEKHEAMKAYHAAMAAFKSEPLSILKDKAVGYQTKNGFTGYKHATLGNIAEIINPALSKHGLSATWNVEQGESGVKVICTITHALGHAESVSMIAPPDNSGKKNQIQQVASTTTYLQRYTLLAATGQATQDMGDDDAQGAYQQNKPANQKPQQPKEQKSEPPTLQDYIDGCDYFLDNHKTIEAFESWLNNKMPEIETSPDKEKILSYAKQIRQPIIDNQPAQQEDIPL